MKSIFITGGAGYIGTTLIPLLLENNFKITVYDSLMFNNGDKLIPYMTNKNFTFIEGDITVTTGTGYPQVAGANYGLPVYIRESNGTIMSTTIPTTGYVRLLGYCYHYIGGSSEWIMKFRPSHEWIEL